MKLLVAFVLFEAVCSALPTSPADERFLRKEVCYEGLGCFSNSYPWTALQRPFPELPDKPDRIGTRFLLYTRENPTPAEEFELLPNKPLMLDFSPFNGTKKTTFVIHGFTQDSRADWFLDMIKELLKSEDMNVIGVDWKVGAAIPYIQASANTRVVGAEISRIIDFLMQYGKIAKDRIHLIGHSLGAHVAGYVGQRQSGIARISALDPAQPYFNGVDRIVRLDETDATLVDVIHSDASPILLLGLGLSTPSGHIDFYPNNGKSQPGCSDSIGKLISSITELLTLDLQGTIDEFACSHMRSTYLYVESINPKRHFIGYPCKSWKKFTNGECFSSCQNKECSTMGYQANKFPQRGSLYLYTEDAAPFVTRDIKVQISIAISQEPTFGKLHVILVGMKGISENIQIHNDKMHSGDTIEGYIQVAGAGEKDIGDITSVSLQYVRGWFQKNELLVSGVVIQDFDSEVHSVSTKFSSAILTSGESVNVHPM